MITPVIFFLVVLKATLFSSGGLTNLPSIRQDLLARHWATGTDFTQAIAIGQVSPGPNGLWVVSLGYFTGGYLGAALALVAITLPPLVVLVISTQYSQLEHHPRVRGAMRGVSHAVVALVLTVVWTILRQPGVDSRGLVLAAGAFGLALTRRVHVIIILALAAIAGYFLYH